MLKKHPVLVYTIARLLILAASGAVLWLLGTRGLLWVLLSFVIAALVSYVLLSKLRDDVGRRFGGVFTRINQRIEDSKVAEDDLIDAARASSPADESAAGSAQPDPDSERQPEDELSAAGPAEHGDERPAASPGPDGLDPADGERQGQPAGDSPDR